MSRLERAVQEALNKRAQPQAEKPPEAGREAAPAPLAQPPAPDEATADEMIDAVLDEAPSPAAPAAVGAPAAGIYSPPRSRSHFVLLKREDNPIASEEYGKIKTQIMRAAEQDPSLRSILITSTIKQEGKSLTSLNLAISLARSYDHKVLLVDTDLRAPSIHRYLDIDPEPGLLQCLREGLPLGEAERDIGAPNLRILTAGGIAADPVELLSSTSAQNFLTSLSGPDHKMFVLIDSPPVLPFADAFSLLPVVGGVIYVVREGRPRVAQIQQALSSLGGAKLLGVVFNGASLSVKKSDGYYGYGY